MEVLQACFAVTGKECPQPEPVINKTMSVSNLKKHHNPQNHIKNGRMHTNASLIKEV